ncbi:MAG: hypothetical protein EOP49_45600, partial [Sphingobacteriales bacterium]
MRNYIFAPFAASLLLLLSPNSTAQTNTAPSILAKATVATPEEDNYDVKYVKIDLQATNTSTMIAGSSLTRAVVTAPSITEYYFELTSQLTIDSAHFNGQYLPVTQVNGFVNKIVLPAAL